jgi:hypothetical protein
MPIQKFFSRSQDIVCVEDCLSMVWQMAGISLVVSSRTDHSHLCLNCACTWKGVSKSIVGVLHVL